MAVGERGGGKPKKRRRRTIEQVRAERPATRDIETVRATRPPPPPPANRLEPQVQARHQVDLLNRRLAGRPASGPGAGRSDVAAYIEGLARIYAAGPSTLVLGHPDPLTGLRDARDFARDAKNAVMSRDVTLKQRVEAGTGVLGTAGILGPDFGFRGKKPPAPQQTGMPPVPPGHVRLYRGEGATKPIDENELGAIGAMDKGGWFTDTRAVAEEYARRNNGTLHYIDVPEEAARPWSRRREDDSGREWTEYRFPDFSEWGQRARVEKRLVEDAADSVAPVPGAEQIVGSLGEAKRLRRQQEKLYRAERGRRGARSEQAAQDVEGQAGYHAALRELKGELPKLKFGALEGQMDQQMVDNLFTHIQRREDLRPYEKLNAQRALTGALEGKVPTRSDIRMLARVFGPDTAAQIQQSVTFWAKAKHVGLNVLNIPRSLKSSFDLSAPFRQGLVLGARHPRMFAREFGPMLKSFRSESAYRDVMDDIASRTSFDAMTKAKLALTDLEGLTNREEMFMSNYAEHIPIAGRGVRASGRGYVAFLNKFRADAFDHYLDVAEAQGRDIEDPALLNSIANWVNHATGRGSIKSLEGAMVPLNSLLFSPRLIASRVNLLFNPGYYAKLDPFARKQAIRGMTQLAGAVSLTLWLAKLAGADVGLDPRSADFAKIRVGNTRIDVAGGFQQYMVAAYRLAKGETVSSTTGQVTQLEGGFLKPSRADIAQRFGEQKLGPVPAYVNSWAKNETFAGPFDPVKDTARLFVPLGAESTVDTYRESGPAPAAATGVLGSIGFGLQTYESVPAKPEPPRTLSEKVAKSLGEERRTARRLGVQLPKEVQDAVKLREAMAQRVDDLQARQKKRGDVVTPEGKRFKLTAKQKAAAELTVVRDMYPDLYAGLKQTLDALPTESAVESFRRQLKAELGLDVLEQWHREVNEALAEVAVAQ